MPINEPEWALEFVGSSHDDLKDFPLLAKRRAGYQLDKVQRGVDPDDWGPMAGVGPGAREIRISIDEGWFRVLYVAKFDDCVYVLHCFQKKTNKTRKQDLDLAKTRYQQIKKAHDSARKAKP